VLVGLLTGPENFGFRFSLQKPGIITPEMGPEILVLAATTARVHSYVASHSEEPALYVFPLILLASSPTVPWLVVLYRQLPTGSLCNTCIVHVL